jgi:hypothetical protein
MEAASSHLEPQPRFRRMYQKTPNKTPGKTMSKHNAAMIFDEFI